MPARPHLGECDFADFIHELVVELVVGVPGPTADKGTGLQVEEHPELLGLLVDRLHALDQADWLTVGQDARVGCEWGDTVCGDRGGWMAVVGGSSGIGVRVGEKKPPPPNTVGRTVEGSGDTNETTPKQATQNKRLS
jgi:hypothetical protein